MIVPFWKSALAEIDEAMTAVNARHAAGVSRAGEARLAAETGRANETSQAEETDPAGGASQL